MALFLLAGETASEILGDAGITILIGLVVVFSVLLLLTGIFKLFGVIMEKLEHEASSENNPSAASSAPAAVAAAPVPAANIGPMISSAQVRNGISDEETAVIAAAVAATLPAGKAYEIRKIDRGE